MALIFFDYDGVVVDSLEVETQNFVSACHEVGIDAVNTSDDMAKLSEGNFYQGLMDWGVPQDKLKVAMDIYAQKKESPDFHVDAHKPIVKLLKKLTKHYPVYVVTSNTSNTVERIMAENGVEGIKEVLGAEKETSKILKLHKVMAQYPGEKTIFVGDTKGDMVEAAEAGIDVRIGVTWGWQKPWIVASGNPDYIFDDFSTLRAWFKGFMKVTK